MNKSTMFTNAINHPVNQNIKQSVINIALQQAIASHNHNEFVTMLFSDDSTLTISQLDNSTRYLAVA